MSDLIISGTTVSNNATVGSVIVAGGISITCTNNATSNTVGGSLTVNGGASIRKSLYVGEELYINNANLTPNPGDKWKSTIFSASNNFAVDSFAGYKPTLPARSLPQPYLDQDRSYP